MEKDKIIASLKEDEEEKKGKVLEIKEDGISYYDYDNDEIFFRFPEFCTKENLEKIIYLGKKSKKRGLTASHLSEAISTGFESMNVPLSDAMCVLRGIIVFSNYTDLKKGLKKICPDEDIDLILDIVDYDDMIENGTIAKHLYSWQVALINEKAIADFCASDCDEILGYDEEYCSGIIITAIHECRHDMMDCNIFLPEEEYPLELASEEKVEKFARDAYDSLPSSLQEFEVNHEHVQKGVINF